MKYHEIRSESALSVHSAFTETRPFACAPQTKKPETQSLALSSERLNMLNGPKPWTMGINDLHVLRPILASTYCIHPSVHPSIHRVYHNLFF